MRLTDVVCYSEVVRAELGQDLRLRCRILGRRNSTGVSWTKQTRQDPANPIALTYNNRVG
jgi:hypothetical protein